MSECFGIMSIPPSASIVSWVGIHGKIYARSFHWGEGGGGNRGH